MKKRFSLIAVFAMLALVLASCGGKYTIEFVEKNGTAIYEPIEFGAGKEIVMPANPTKDGLTFDGWYEDPGFDVEFIDTVMPAESLVLYAKWVATLTFDSMGGTECSSITNTPASFAQLPEPTKDGFVFAGWYQDQAYTTEQKNVVPAKHATVYAKWQVKNSNTYYPLTNWRDNDGSAYNITKTEEGTTITATENKGEWSYAYDLINIDGTGFRVVELVVEGTKDCEAVIKLEGGDAQAVETRVKFTGEEQTITWVVKANNITTKPGQKLLIFLNAGNKGYIKTPAGEGTEAVKFEEAPYVTIKSSGLYQPQDIGVTSDTYAIHFDSNGGSSVESVYAKAGTDVKTKTPKKEGYTFAGWYTDKELTQAFDGKMPAAGTILYAKWIVTINVLGDKFVCGDNVAEKVAINYSYKDGVLSVQKTANGGEWTAMASKEKGNVLAGATKCTVVLTGTKDKQILVKINDAYETWVTCTGEEQTVEIDLTGKTFDANKTALLLFPEGGKATEGAEFAIKSISFNSTTPVDLAAKEFVCGDNVAEKIVVSSTFAEGVLTVYKTANGTGWECAKSTLIGKDILGAGKLVVTLKGPQGKQILVKVNDHWAGEAWITCTGEEQTVVIDCSTVTLNAKNSAVLLFPEANATGTEAKFEISELYFIIESERVNDGFASPEFVAENAEKIVIDHSITKGVLTLVKNDNAGSYAAVKSVVMGDAIAQANTLTITYNAPEGVQLLVKINDKWYLETWLTGTGKEETQVIDFSRFRINPAQPALLLFPEGGKEGADNITNSKIVISKLEFDNGVNLLANDYKIDSLYTSFTCGDNVIARNPIEQKFENGVLTISKNAADAYAWSNVASHVLGDTLTYTTLRVIVKGPKDEQLLVKVNEQLEVMVTTTGEQQVVDIDLSELKVNKKNVALRLFPEPGKEGEAVKGSKFEISSILLSNYVALDSPLISYDLLEDTYTSNDEGSITVSTKDGALVLKKNTLANDNSWAYVKSTLKGSAIAAGYTKLVVTVKGPEGKKVLFKVNDQNTGEGWVTCTGKEETHVFDISNLDVNENGLAMLIFPAVETSGESGEFTISEMYLSTYNPAVNLLNDTYVSNDEGSITVSTKDGALVLKKNTLANDNSWAFVKSTLKGSAIAGGYTKLIVTVKGPEGKKVLFKANDQNTGEGWVTCTGKEETHVFDISNLEVNENGLAMLIFPAVETSGESGEFVISQMKVANVADPLELTKDTFVSNDEGSIAVSTKDGALVLKKNTLANDNSWAFVKSTLKGSAIVGYTQVKVTITGPEGKKALFKVNDQNTGEAWVTCTGKPQTVIINIQELEVNENGLAMLIFPAVETSGESGEFVIHSIKFYN